MAGKKHRNGDKVAGRHTTIIDAAEKVFDFIKKIPEVSSITAGKIKMNLPTAPHRVSYREESGCLMIKVRGTKSIQELKVYSRSIARIKIILEEKFPHK